MATAEQQNNVVIGASRSCGPRRGKSSQFVLLGLGLSAATAFAQQAPDAGALQRELELQLQRELTIPQARPAKPVRNQDLEATGETITLAGFKYQGNTLFSSDEINTVTHSVKAIAIQLSLSPHTVMGYTKSIYAKLGVHSKNEALYKALTLVNQLTKR